MGAKRKLSHRWSMFASLSTGVKDTAKYIKSVTYHLHPTYAKPVIKVTEAPFLLTRVSWGYFEVKMVIEFQRSTGLKTKELTHMLHFDGDGHTRSFLLEVNAKSDNSVA